MTLRAYLLADFSGQVTISFLPALTNYIRIKLFWNNNPAVISQ